MSIELILARFDPDDTPPEGLNLIPRLAEVARFVLKDSGHDESAVMLAPDGDGLLIDLPGGTAEVHGGHAQFPIHKLDPLTLRMIFEIARAGDMVAIADGGKYRAILTQVAQRLRLPDEWQAPELTPVCQSAEHFELLLQEWHAAHDAYAKRAFKKLPKIEPQPGAAPVVSGGQRDSRIMHLHRFDRSGDQRPKHPEVLADLMRVAKNILGDKAVIMGKYRDTFGIKFPAGSAEVYANRAVFDVFDVDLPTARIIYETAWTGDMAIITWKHLVGCRSILTDPDQLSRVPEGWRGQVEGVCRSPVELVPLLRKRLELDIPDNERVIFCGESPCPSGTRPNARVEFIYVEAKPKETASKHQKQVFKFHRDRTLKLDPVARANLRPGIMMAGFWRLETPAGKSFYAYDYSGDLEMRRATMRDFAAAEGRMLGRIVNFETFLQDDGVSFPLSICTITKARG